MSDLSAVHVAWQQLLIAAHRCLQSFNLSPTLLMLNFLVLQAKVTGSQFETAHSL